jgi:hypothetical protein
VVADRDGDGEFWTKVGSEEVPHCGLCDHTRHIEQDDGRVARCPRCWPPHADKPNAPRLGDLLPQHWRCGRCHAVIYRTDRDLPCEMHRAVSRWQADYDEAQSGQQALAIVNPVTEAGAAVARARLGPVLARVAVSRAPPDPEPPPPHPGAEPTEPWPGPPIEPWPAPGPWPEPDDDGESGDDDEFPF